MWKVKVGRGSFLAAAALLVANSMPSTRLAAAASRATAGDAKLLEELARVRALRSDHSFPAALEYQRVFDEHGLPVVSDAPERSVEAFVEHLRGRPEEFLVRLASYMDDWGASSRVWGADAKKAGRLSALARAIDPNPRRNAVRDGLSLPTPDERSTALKRLSAAGDLAAQPAETLVVLASALRASGEAEAAVAVLEQGRPKHADDPWLLQELGLALRSVRPSAKRSMRSVPPGPRRAFDRDLGLPLVRARGRRTDR